MILPIVLYGCLAIQPVPDWYSPKQWKLLERNDKETHQVTTMLMIAEGEINVNEWIIEEINFSPSVRNEHSPIGYHMVYNQTKQYKFLTDLNLYPSTNHKISYIAGLINVTGDFQVSTLNVNRNELIINKISNDNYNVVNKKTNKKLLNVIIKSINGNSYILIYNKNDKFVSCSLYDFGDRDVFDIETVRWGLPEKPQEVPKRVFKALTNVLEFYNKYEYYPLRAQMPNLRSPK